MLIKKYTTLKPDYCLNEAIAPPRVEKSHGTFWAEEDSITRLMAVGLTIVLEHIKTHFRTDSCIQLMPTEYTMIFQCLFIS